MLKVKLLNSAAKAPTVAHPGEDLEYDIYASETVIVPVRGHAQVSTGIAVECSSPSGDPMGALLRDKSSIAARRLVLTGGVIDDLSRRRAPIGPPEGELHSTPMPVETWRSEEHTS